jgi:hypothetical protein
MHKVLSLDPKFTPSESWLFNSLQAALGFATTEWIASIKRSLVGRYRRKREPSG